MKKTLITFAVIIFSFAPASAMSKAPVDWNPNQNKVSITDDGQYRYIQSNGIPDHYTGQFPNRRNPNTIQEQKHQYRVPLHPVLRKNISKLEMHPFGVAINGIPFDPGAAEFWNRDRNSGWQYEALSGKIDLGMDENNAHVQPGGSYHYHGLPAGLISSSLHSPLIGYAADGFPIYARYGYSDPEDSDSQIKKLTSSYRLKKGSRPDGPGGEYDGSFVEDYEYVNGQGDLDECNGRFGKTPEYFQGTYHYFVTEEFPFIPRYFHGTPDNSFMRHGPRGGMHKQPPHHKRFK
ncbi:MAG: hypothetical protein ACI8RA_001767 [Chlamydiales bacterium]|jgi:hypothetical protein